MSKIIDKVKDAVHRNHHSSNLSPTVPLAEKKVGPIGFGLMGMTDIKFIIICTSS
jgi:hypothetical protein